MVYQHLEVVACALKIWRTIFGDELSVRCWIVGAMFPPAFDLRRSVFEDRRSKIDAKIDGRWSKVDAKINGRRSMVDDRWSMVDGR